MVFAPSLIAHVWKTHTRILALRIQRVGGFLMMTSQTYPTFRADPSAPGTNFALCIPTKADAAPTSTVGGTPPTAARAFSIRANPLLQRRAMQRTIVTANAHAVRTVPILLFRRTYAIMGRNASSLLQVTDPTR